MWVGRGVTTRWAVVALLKFLVFNGHWMLVGE
jgi:hypothetical protein